MLRPQSILLQLPLALLLTVAAHAEDVFFRGKVTMEDGSPPGRLVTIQRVCIGMDHPFREGMASNKTGEYYVRLSLDVFGTASTSMNGVAMMPCHLEAVATGYVSNPIDLMNRAITSNPRLPNLVLTPVGAAKSVAMDADIRLPHGAGRAWEEAVKLLTARNWAAAEQPLRTVVQSAPRFAAGWSTLGADLSNLQKPAEAAEALSKAIQLEPKTLPPYFTLASVQSELEDWKGAAETSQALITADPKHAYVEALLVNAVARFHLADLDGALTQATEALRFDKQHKLPRAEFVAGVILEARKEYLAAELHFQSYIAENPYAPDVSEVRKRIANLGKNPEKTVSADLTAADLKMAAVGEAPVPGGLKAFAAVAQLPKTPTYNDFFLEYCRAVIGTETGMNPTHEAGDAVRAFIASMMALERIGETSPENTHIHMSVDNDEQVRKTTTILAQLGWKLVAKGDSFTVEAGDQRGDGFRQWALTALGVDELALRQAIESKRDFDFDIPRESARLVGGAAWGLILKGVPDVVGGPSDIFMRDSRFARVYIGLGAMNGETAATVVSAVGLANLIVKYPSLVANYAGAITMVDKRIVLPGGAEVAGVWNKLSGVNPQNTTLFLRALFEKDQGRLLAFYSDLVHADAEHQKYFTQSLERADAFYKWYVQAVSAGEVSNPDRRWQAHTLQAIPIDAAGRLQLPGGRAAWTAGSENEDEILLRRAPLEALTAIVLLEQKRGASLSPSAVQLIAEHYAEWRTLFPYFEKLPGLDANEFQALAEFTAVATKAAKSRQNVLLGDWHSLVALTVMGTESGALDAAHAAQAFQRTCEALKSENPSTAAIAALQGIAGGGEDVDEAIPARLLRLSGNRREAFENGKALQNVPAIRSLGQQPDAAKTLAALSGLVYAAQLEPTDLLMAEDPELLSRHVFVIPSEPSGRIFAQSVFTISNDAPGSNFAGGFATFAAAAAPLRERKVDRVVRDSAAGAVVAQVEAAPGEGRRTDFGPRASGELVFHAGGRVVEVYATVTDSRGRYVDDLSSEQFTVLEQGQPKPVFAFENHSSAVSVALVFDTTGSMVSALSPLKSAALQLIEDLRPTDSVAVYSFNDRVSELQPFTSDKESAKRAILKTHAAGITALYDALIRVNHDLSQRPGKKVIIVFTDGADNASMLSSNIAIERAKGRGIPIYTIAEGEALLEPQLIAELSKMSRATGGTPFLIRKLSDISGVFEKMSADLMHGYLVAFQPSPGEGHDWHRIQINLLRVPKGMQVRAREGFYVE